MPLCKEFSSFENINDAFKNPLKKLTSSGINFTLCDTHIDINFENESYDMYNINFIGVNLNSMMVAHGVCCMRYAN